MIDKYDVISDGGTYIKIPDPQIDYVAMISKGQTYDLWEANLFVDTIKERFDKIICVADEVISSLKRNLDYGGYYTAFLLDQLSEEEFQKISEDCSISLQMDVTEEEIREKVRILLGISKEKFTSSDLSNIFKIGDDLSEDIVNRLKEEGFIL